MIVEREHLAGADQAGGLNDVLGAHVIERADLIVLAPAAPLLQLLRRFGDRLSAHLDVHQLFLLMPFRDLPRRAAA